ncbi:hypothetical protein [Collimonas pratensis]|nr:hypothetical protein [Collimonas pratensis]
MKIASTTLPQRIELVADGRKIHPWAKSIGVSKGSIEGVMKLDGMLSGETLSYIHRTENVRIDWLLEGRGKQYAVNICTSDEDACELLDALFEEQWNVWILSDRVRMAIVLDQPASFSVKDGKTEAGEQQWRDIPYRVVEVITGTIGAKTLDCIRPKAGQDVVHLLDATSETLARLEKGMIGTYRLFHSPDALMHSAGKITAKHRIFNEFTQQELFPASPEEKALLGHFRAMGSEKRKTVAEVATALAQHEVAPEAPVDVKPKKNGNGN